MILVYGLAIFSMFFGSGNLVFPIAIGVDSSSVIASAIGLGVSAIIVPCIGCISVILSGLGIGEFLRPIGKLPSQILILLMMLLLGPLGVIPRSIIVAKGGLSLVFSYFPDGILAAIIALMGYLLAQLPGVVKVIGKVFTPLILAGLSIIFITGINFSSSITPGKQGFYDALLTGYQTMDLIAALFFAQALVNSAQSTMRSKDLVFSSVIGFGCLMAVYILMIVVSNQYAGQLVDISAEHRMVSISQFVLGDYAKVIASFVICFSCITTLSVLLKEFSIYIEGQIPALSCDSIMLVTIIISYFGSFLGFSIIASYLGMLLSLIYPSIIFLALLRLLKFSANWICGGFYFMLAVNFGCLCLGGI